jgi:DNA-binding transcriptional LysR family regulator
MELHQLRCFVAAAEELHFGKAAQRLQMLPSALGRHIRLLEQDLGAPLFIRTTRSVSLTEDGSGLLREARAILARVAAVEASFRQHSRARRTRRFRIGAIDSAAAGLLPPLLRDLNAQHPEIAIQLLEEKTIRLLPKILSGAIDLAFVRLRAAPTSASSSGRCFRKALSWPFRGDMRSRGAGRFRLRTSPTSL